MNIDRIIPSYIGTKKHSSNDSSYKALDVTYNEFYGTNSFKNQRVLDGSG